MKKIVLLLLLLSNFVFAGVNLFISKNNTDIKQDASNDSKVLQKVKRGSQFELISEEGDWYKVKLLNGYGYVSRNNAMKIKTSNAQSQNYNVGSVDKQTASKVKNAQMDNNNKEWSQKELDDVKSVKEAYTKAQSGVDGAIVALVNALESTDNEVSLESEKSLISIGVRSLNALSKKTKSKTYTVKSRAVDVISKINSQECVPYLEKVIKDVSIETEVVSALNSIGGIKSREALERYNQSKIMKIKIDSIRAYEEGKERAQLTRLGLTYGETKNNILDVAMKLSKFKKLNTDGNNAEYKEYRSVFAYLEKKYDNALGAGATEGLLKDNGYSSEIVK